MKKRIQKGYSVGCSVSPNAQIQKAKRRSVNVKDIRGRISPQHPPKKS